MKNRNFVVGRSFVAIFSLLIGAALAILVVCFYFNRVADFYRHPSLPELEDYQPMKPPTPLYVIPSLEKTTKATALSGQENLGILMLNTFTNQRRFVKNSDELEKWSPGDQAIFAVSIGEYPEGISPEMVVPIICDLKDSSHQAIFIIASGTDEFRIEEWGDILAKECNCTNLAKKP